MNNAEFILAMQPEIITDEKERQLFVKENEDTIKYVSTDKWGNVTPLTLWVDHLLHEAIRMEEKGYLDCSKILLDAAVNAEVTGEKTLSGRALSTYNNRP